MKKCRIMNFDEVKKRVALKDEGKPVHIVVENLKNERKEKE